jgi:hypothetical protein
MPIIWRSNGSSPRQHGGSMNRHAAGNMRFVRTDDSWRFAPRRWEQLIARPAA